MADMLKMYDVVVETHVGVFDWERRELQKIWLDIELPIDARAAAKVDDVQHVVDYGALVTQVRQHIAQRTYHLMETIAEETAQLILDHFPTNAVQVRVKKRALPGVDHACVEILRTKSARASAKAGKGGSSRTKRPSPTGALR